MKRDESWVTREVAVVDEKVVCVGAWELGSFRRLEKVRL